MCVRWYSSQILFKVIPSYKVWACNNQKYNGHYIIVPHDEEARIIIHCVGICIGPDECWSWWSVEHIHPPEETIYQWWRPGQVNITYTIFQTSIFFKVQFFSNFIFFLTSLKFCHRTLPFAFTEVGGGIPVLAFYIYTNSAKKWPGMGQKGVCSLFIFLKIIRKVNMEYFECKQELLWNWTDVDSRCIVNSCFVELSATQLRVTSTKLLPRPHHFLLPM